MKSTKIWVILLGLVLVIACAALYLQQQEPTVEGGVAVVSIDGEVTQRIDLSKDDTYIIETDEGTNTLTVKDGTIAVTDADCPDQVCVDTGAISTSAKPIVCLPHKLVIEIQSNNNDIDATAQ